jgi:prepilin-type N-terminal cleavage/methylation domain-containing protein
MYGSLENLIFAHPHPMFTCFIAQSRQRVSQATSRLRRQLRRAFTLVELLLVVAIISILAAMVISHFADAAQGARNVVAQQQLASWQNALNNWVNSRVGKIDTTIEASGAEVSLNTLTGYYNNLTRRQRFVLLCGKDLNGTAGATTGYLEPMTADHFISAITSSGANNTSKIIYTALQQTNQWLELPAWTVDSYPVVELHDTVRDAAASRSVPADTTKS